jgi:hypothetical protein
MKRIILVIGLIPILANSQTTHTVCNMDGFPANFKSLQEAINSPAVAAGDILLVQGSAANYGDIEVNKKVIIMGPGYFLGENPETQTNLMSAKVNSIHFVPGSEGSVMQGMEVTGTSVTETFYHYCGGFIGNNYSVLIDANAIGIISNRLHQALVIKSALSGLVSRNYLNYFFLIDTTTHLSISNNIISGDFTAKNSSVSNNIINAVGYIELSNCSVNGNIFPGVGAPICGSNSNYSNNVFSFNPFGEDVGSNIVDVPQNDIFVSSTGQSSDGRYKLKPNSPAAIKNVGPFVGPSPYRLSGISLHPNIFSVTMPQTATNGGGLKVEVKVRAND